MSSMAVQHAVKHSSSTGGQQAQCSLTGLHTPASQRDAGTRVQRGAQPGERSWEVACRVRANMPCSEPMHS